MNKSDSSSTGPDESPQRFASSPCYLHEFADFESCDGPIVVQRIYDSHMVEEGKRFLIDRLWPRGIRKEDAALDAWLKDVAPSTELRRRFHKNPDEWESFSREYVRELWQLKMNGNEQLKLLEQAAHSGHTVFLLFASRNEKENHALLLKDFLLHNAG